MIEAFGITVGGQNIAVYLACLFIIAGSIFSLYTLLQRLSAQSRLYRGSLVLLNLLAGGALLGLVLQPSYLSRVDVHVTLMTASASQTKTTNETFTRDIVEPKTKAIVYRLNKQSPKNINTGRSVAAIDYSQQVLLRHPKLNSITIEGDGLDKEQWQGFEQVEITYSMPPHIDGFINVTWTKDIALGEFLHLSGEMSSLSAAASEQALSTVRLLDPADQVVASERLRRGEYFHLSTRPKLVGLHAYRLQFIDRQQQIVSEELVHIAVRDSQPLRLFILQSAPSFEGKHLQNWAAERGAQIIKKTKISRDRFVTRLTNVEAQRDEISNTQLILSEALLDTIDLIITDARTLTTMDENNLGILHSSIEAGLGVLILSDRTLTEITPTNALSLVDDLIWQEEDKRALARLSWQDGSGQFALMSELLLPVFPFPYVLKNNEFRELSHLVISERGVPLVSSFRYQLGTVSISRIKESHRLVTAGELPAYSHLWQMLISHTSRTRNTPFIVDDHHAAFTFVGERKKVCAFTAIHRAALLHARQPSAAKPESNSRSLRCAYFWPQHSGWYRAKLRSEKTRALEADPAWFYVQPADAWQGLRQNEKIRATLAAQSSFAHTSPQPGHQQNLRPISLWLFWWVFIASVGLMWLERKTFVQSPP